MNSIDFAAVSSSEPKVSSLIRCNLVFKFMVHFFWFRNQKVIQDMSSLIRCDSVLVQFWFTFVWLMNLIDFAAVFSSDPRLSCLEAPQSWFTFWFLKQKKWTKMLKTEPHQFNELTSVYSKCCQLRRFVVLSGNPSCSAPTKDHEVIDGKVPNRVVRGCALLCSII